MVHSQLRVMALPKKLKEFFTWLQKYLAICHSLTVFFIIVSQKGVSKAMKTE